jgi:hypothetical protein
LYQIIETMKKIIAAFITLFMFSMIQASPNDPSLSLSETAVLTDLELNEGTSFLASKEMPRKKKASRKGKRSNKRREK